jgi:hypothetical protein
MPIFQRHKLIKKLYYLTNPPHYNRTKRKVDLFVCRPSCTLLFLHFTCGCRFIGLWCRRRYRIFPHSNIALARERVKRRKTKSKVNTIQAFFPPEVRQPMIKKIPSLNRCFDAANLLYTASKPSLFSELPKGHKFIQKRRTLPLILILMQQTVTFHTAL